MTGIIQEMIIRFISKKNYDIMVVKHPVCGGTSCQKQSKTKISFQKESKDQIKQFLDEQLQNHPKKLVLEYSKLSQRDLIIIESIIYNDEIHLKKVEYLKKRLFTLTSSRLDCESVKLEIYDDNTYQYFDSKYPNGEFILTKTDTYSYDVINIIKNKDQYPKNEHGPYQLVNDKNETFNIYDNNQELNEFLNSIGLSLDQCIKVQ